MEDYNQDGRRRVYPIILDEETIELIAEKAAEKAIIKMENRLYTQVGKSFISNIIKVAGIIGIGILLWLNQKGLAKF